MEHSTFELFGDFLSTSLHDSLSHNLIRTIYEDSTGTLWIGTSDGLNTFDRATETFRCYTEEHGLPSPVINGIVEDDQGNLWISSSNGLSRFNPQTETFRNYDVSDGLQRRFFRGRV